MQHKNIALYAFLAFSFSTSWIGEAGEGNMLFQGNPSQKQGSLTLSRTQFREQTNFPPLPQPPVLQFRSLNHQLGQDFYPYGSQNAMQRVGRACDVPLLEIMPLDSQGLCPDGLRTLPKDRARRIIKTTWRLWSLEQWAALIEAADFQQIPAIKSAIDRNSPQQPVQSNRQHKRPEYALRQQRNLSRPTLPHAILRIPTQNHIGQLSFAQSLQQRQGGRSFPRRPFCGGSGFRSKAFNRR